METNLSPEESRLLRKLFLSRYVPLKGTNKSVFDTLEMEGFAVIVEGDLLAITSKGSAYMLEHWVNEIKGA